MPYERDDEPVKHQREARPVRRTTSSKIKIYCLLCGSAAILAGHTALIGVMAEGFSEHIIRNISLTVAVFSILALPIGVLAIALSGFIERRSSNSIIQAIARIFSDLIVGPLAIFLLLLLWGSGNALFQLSLGQFLLGENDIQFRHLMILSAYSGTLFGIYAGWNGKSSHRLKWIASVGFGLRVSMETAFLAYAGLWLAKDPFKYALTQGDEGNWGVMAIALLGTFLIFVGSISLMARQSHTPPQPSASAKQIPFRTKASQKIQDLISALLAIKCKSKRLIITIRKFTTPKSLRIRTTVLRGGRVAIVSPESEAGQKVDVVVRLVE